MEFKLQKPNDLGFLTFSANLEDFNSKKVIYHKPEVWRLWLQVGEYRVNLHKIFKSETTELFHPHPWMMRTEILKGVCEVGFGFGVTEPELNTKAIFSANSSYEMLHPKTWHYVKPLSEEIITIMVSSAPWKEEAHFDVKPTLPQPELTPEEKLQLWNEVCSALERK